MRKQLLFVLAMVLLVGAVSAFVDVPYTFTQDNVDVVAVNCLNADCSSVAPFSGSFPNGASTTDGTIKIQYPSSLATANGYGVLYFAKGYLPMAYKASWNNNGYSDVLTASPLSISFDKKSSCTAHVDNYKVSTDAYENVPLIVALDASMDADVHS